MPFSPSDLVHRPLRGGVTIYNPQIDAEGTLGLFGTDTNQGLHLISCAHVLSRSQDAAGHQAGDPIFQPWGRAGTDQPIAHTTAGHVDFALDVASAKVESTLSCVAEMIGIGAVKDPIAPVVGMRVVKTGSATSVSEGIITQVDADSFEIEPVPGFPAGYRLTERRDSGAAWVDVESRRPVGIHKIGNIVGPEWARATTLSAALASLSLQLVTG